MYDMLIWEILKNWKYFENSVMIIFSYLKITKENSKKEKYKSKKKQLKILLNKLLKLIFFYENLLCRLALLVFMKMVLISLRTHFLSRN